MSSQQIIVMEFFGGFRRPTGGVIEFPAMGFPTFSSSSQDINSDESDSESD